MNNRKTTRRATTEKNLHDQIKFSGFNADYLKLSHELPGRDGLDARMKELALDLAAVMAERKKLDLGAKDYAAYLKTPSAKYVNMMYDFTKCLIDADVITEGESQLAMVQVARTPENKYILTHNILNPGSWEVIANILENMLKTMGVRHYVKY
jgi:hypothetical protein